MADDQDPTDDLADRLQRLAPGTNVDAAFASLEHATVHDRTGAPPLLAIAAAVLAVLLLGGGVALARRTTDIAIDTGAWTATTMADPPGTTDPPGSTIAPATTAGPSTTTMEAPPITTASTAPPAPLPTAASTAPVATTAAPAPAARADEIEVAIHADKDAVRLGERVHLDVVVTNHSAGVASFTSGGCGPTNIHLEGLPVVTDPGPMWWNRAPNSLGGHLAGGNLARTYGPIVPAASAQDAVPDACFSISRIDHLDPGQTVTREYVWDAVVPPSETTVPASVTAVAWVLVRESDIPAGSNYEGAEVTAHAEIRVVDDPRAHLPTDAGVRAIEADPLVRQWLDGHGDCTVRVVFRNGHEEYWFQTVDMIRLRALVEPETGTITEIRTLGPGSPSDDPDATRSGTDTETVLLSIS